VVDGLEHLRSATPTARCCAERGRPCWGRIMEGAAGICPTGRNSLLARQAWQAANYSAGFVVTRDEEAGCTGGGSTHNSLRTGSVAQEVGTDPCSEFICRVLWCQSGKRGMSMQPRYALTLQVRLSLQAQACRQAVAAARDSIVKASDEVGGSGSPSQGLQVCHRRPGNRQSSR
jgi:hypothetical protein